MVCQILIGMNEGWKDVNGYEGLYVVSSLGRIKSVGGATWKRYTRKTERLLKSHPNSRKYYTVSLYDTDGKKKTQFLHQVVATAFLGANLCCPTCGSTFEINHKNGDKSDNSVSNLEYVTHRTNMSHYHGSVKSA
jgi:hypothetical protein